MANKIEDLRNDMTILQSDIICLSETWLMSDSIVDSSKIPGYDVDVNSVGKGKGIMTYFKPTVGIPSAKVKKPKVQISQIDTEKVDVINIYRSQGADNSEIAVDLIEIIEKGKPSIICGDIYLCYIDERNNDITRMLESQGFEQLVTESSHLQGGHIDHVYSNLDPAIFKVEVSMYSPYYTCRDHDAFCISITHR